MIDGASAAGDELDATLALRDLLSEVTARFAAAAIDGAEREARWIVEEASGHGGPEFALSLDRPATEREVVRIDAMTARRVAGEPLQYVLGRWAFRHLDLAVDSRVLIPRAETEVTAEVAIDAARRVAEPIVVDLGTGSGAIGLSVAWECRHAHVWATDRSSEALEVARANLAGLGRAGARVRRCRTRRMCASTTRCHRRSSGGSPPPRSDRVRMASTPSARSSLRRHGGCRRGERSCSKPTRVRCRRSATCWCGPGLSIRGCGRIWPGGSG